MTVEQIYTESIKQLSAEDRVRLATMIMAELPRDIPVDESDEWSDEDLADLTEFSQISFETGSKHPE